jgi:ABC-type transport system involved in multi-copper enzyme maturation permease subunit
MKLKAIASNTFKEAIRDKIFYNLLIFALLVIVASVLIGYLSVGQSEKFIKDIGLAAISFFGVLTAILVGISLVHKEIDRRTVYTIISKPVHRYEFLLSKYFGLCLTLLVNVVVMTLFLFIVVWWRGYAPSFSLLKAVLLIFFELTLLTSIALLFSTFSSPTLSAIFTLAIYVIGNLTSDLKEIGTATKSEFSRYLIDLCYYVLPNFSNFNIRTEAVHGVNISNTGIVIVLLYSLLYTGVVLFISILSFQRREFN